jgi:hypothetical protein
MNDKLLGFNDPYTIFIYVAAAITILILLLRLFFDCCTLLWKSILISYIVFITLILSSSILEHNHIGIVSALSAILLIPGMLIYGLIPGVTKPCPSDFDVFWWHLIAFIFYAIVIWGIMKAFKINKELNAPEKKQDDNVEKQTPTETNLKDQ